MNTEKVLLGGEEELPLAQAELADVVRLRKPYEPVRGTDRVANVGRQLARGRQD